MKYLLTFLVLFLFSTSGYSQTACLYTAVNQSQRMFFAQYGVKPGFAAGCLVVQADTGILYEWDGSIYTAVGGGGIGLTSLNAQTGNTQIFANDTNILITSSANTHTLSWGGTLSLARGGSAASLTAANGGIVYSDAAKMQILAAGTTGLFLKSNGAAAPSWASASSSPAGSQNQIQFNVGGAFAAQSGFVWDATNFRLGVNQATPKGRIHANASTTSGTVGDDAIILGNVNTTANIGDGATILGGFASANRAAGTNALVTGANSLATGLGSFSGGSGANGSANYSITYGNNLINSGDSNNAMFGGSSTINNGSYGALVYGSSNTMASSIGDSLVGGNSSTVSGQIAQALGEGVTSQGYAQMSIGRFNVLQGTSGSVVSGDSALIIGNGTATGSRHNAFAVLNTGETRIYGTTSNYVGLVSPASPTAHTIILPSNAGATGGLMYYSGADTLSNLIAGTSGQVLLSGGAAAPTWGVFSYNAEVAADGTVSSENSEWITSNCALAASVFTCTVSSFAATPKCVATIKGSTSGQVSVNPGSNTSVVVSTFAGTTGLAADRAFTLWCSK